MSLSPELSRLLLKVTPIASTITVDEAADLFLKPEYERMLSVPVVDEGRPVGIVSRFQLNQIFLRRYGREIYGRYPVGRIMNPKPLLVAAEQTLEQAAQYITANVTPPMREDFVLTEDGRYLGVGIVLDLLKAMEQQVAKNSAQLKASQAQLVQSEKMASLGQMVAGVAHEINTPLGYVRNNVEMLTGVLEQVGGVVDEFQALCRMLTEEGADESLLNQQLLKANGAAIEIRDNKLLEDAAGLFKDTLFGVDQIKELVINLKNFSRLDQAKLAEVSINDCIEQTLTIARNVLKTRVEVVKRYGDVPRLRCSPSQINQVLLNLMTNAAQAIEHDEGKLLIKTDADAQSVHISVQDNGKGIAPENLAKIFDPFFTTKAVGQGTGLGLSISYQIVQAHGGQIKVASQVGKGTKFVVSLPLDAEAPAAAMPEQSPIFLATDPVAVMA